MPDQTDFEKIQREFDTIVEREHLWDTYIKSLSPVEAAIQDREWIANRAQEILASSPPQSASDEGWVPCQIGSVLHVRSGSHMVAIGSNYDRAQAVADALNRPL